LSKFLTAVRPKIHSKFAGLHRVATKIRIIAFGFSGVIIAVVKPHDAELLELKMKKFLPLGMIALSMSCSVESQKSNPNSVVSTQSKWANPSSIPVCIMNRNEVSDELLNDLKNHVTTDYMSKAGIGLVGWEECQPSELNARVIRVTFKLVHNWKGNSIGAGGGLSMVGSAPYSCGGDCRGGTMRLDIGSEGTYPAAGTWARNFAVSQTRATAVHEFGHALGLLHEHERSDAPGCGDYDRNLQNSDRNVFVGEFDANSIMNYCHNRDLTTLSEGDVAGLKYLYPQLTIPLEEIPSPAPTPVP
jgi:hypothetical protein